MKFSSNLGLNSGNQSAQPSEEQMERIVANLTYFITFEVPGIHRHTWDLDALKTALKSSSMRVLPAGGNASRGDFPYRCAVALAEKLETEVVEFPGHHGGYVIYPQEFAERLHDIFVNIHKKSVTERY